MAVDASTLKLHWKGSSLRGTKADGATYTAVWRVETDDSQDQARVVEAYFRNNVIDYGDLYSYGNDSSTLAIAKEIAINRIMPSMYAWEIVVTFKEADLLDQGQQDENGNFSDDPTVWKRIATGIREYKRPVTSAIYRGGYGSSFELRYPLGTTGLVPMNSAFQPFSNPPLEEEDGKEWVMLGGNTFAADTSSVYANLHKVNSNPFQYNIRGISKIVQAEEARIRKITLKPNAYQGANYVEFDFFLEFDNEAPLWQTRVVDKGTLLRACAGDPDGDGGSLSASDFPADTPKGRVAIDHHEEVLGEEFLLDGEGGPLDVCTTDTKPVFADWEHYDRIDFLTIPFLSSCIQGA